MLDKFWVLRQGSHSDDPMRVSPQTTWKDTLRLVGILPLLLFIGLASFVSADDGTPPPARRQYQQNLSWLRSRPANPDASKA